MGHTERSDGRGIWRAAHPGHRRRQLEGRHCARRRARQPSGRGPRRHHFAPGNRASRPEWHVCAISRRAMRGSTRTSSVATVAGADYPEDVRAPRAQPWAAWTWRARFMVLNDTFGALRAGSSAGWGVGLVCGQGINAGAIAPDGRQDRFPAWATTPATGVVAAGSHEPRFEPRSAATTAAARARPWRRSRAALLRCRDAGRS